MSPYRAALLALVVVGTAFATAATAGAASDVDVARDALGGTHDLEDDEQVDLAAQVAVDVAAERASVGDAQQTDENETENDSALGADISSFMQANLAETDGAVENGMWSAAFEGTNNQSVRERLVERRTSELREELAELRAEKQELMAEREAGNLSETAYKARVSRLAGRINSLESSINATSSKARDVGADVEELSTLRTEARNLSGPEVSAVARNVSGVHAGNGQGPPDGVGNGPPDDVGNGSDDAGNGNGPGDAGNGNGSPDDAGANNSSPGRNAPPSDRASAPFDDSAGGDETPGEGAGNGAPGAGTGNDAPGRNANPGQNGTPGQGDGPGEGPGRDGAPGRGPNALASPAGVLDGTNLLAPADGFDVPVVSTVGIAPTDVAAADFSP